MNRGLLQRLIWTYVAAVAAWRFYPRECTVLPNEEVNDMIRYSNQVVGDNLGLLAKIDRLKATPFGAHDCPACGRNTAHRCSEFAK